MRNFPAFCRAAAVATLIASTAAPVLAGEPSGEKQKLTYDPKSDKYCMKAEFTGTRMAKSICRTREQWANEGVVIPQKADTAIAKR